MSTSLHTPVAELQQAAANHALLRLPLNDEHSAVYPAWQFTRTGGTIPHLHEVLDILSRGTPDLWTWALWLAAPDDTFGHRTAWQWLADGCDPAPVLGEAARDAAQWAT